MALKNADIYGNLAAIASKVPPGSSQAKFYSDIAQMVLNILKDADVLPVAMTSPTGPVTGLGKIV